MLLSLDNVKVAHLSALSNKSNGNWLKPNLQRVHAKQTQKSRR